MEFVCKIATAGGEVRSHTEQAETESEVRQRLAAQGYYIFSVQPKNWLGAKLRILRRRIRLDDFVIFNQQFVTLSKSGLPLQKSLELLARQARSPVLRDALSGVRDEVRGGALLSDAFDATGRFPKIYAATVRAGERSGTLDRVLAQYLSYQKLSRGFRKKIVAALIYPSFLVIFLIALISFVVTFIVPRFSMLYSDLNVHLPRITQMTIAFAQGVRHALVEIVLVIILSLLALRAAWQSSRIRLAWDRFKFRLPVVGGLLLKFSVAEFARSLGTLLQAGLPIVEALSTTCASVTSPLVSKAIEDATREVTGGRSLSSSLRSTEWFPATALDMIEVGETTGALPVMLESVAEFYEEDVNIDLAALVALVDPITIAAVALVVGFILITFYLPLFSLYSQMG